MMSSRAARLWPKPLFVPLARSDAVDNFVGNTCRALPLRPVHLSERFRRVFGMNAWKINGLCHLRAGTPGIRDRQSCASPSVLGHGFSCEVLWFQFVSYADDHRCPDTDPQHE